MMADTKLSSPVTESQPLAVLVGGEAAVNAMHAAQRPDTVRCPGLALAGRHSHSVQRCCNMLIRPSAGHAAHDGERLLGCVTAMLAGSQLADAQLGMLVSLSTVFDGIRGFSDQDLRWFSFCFHRQSCQRIGRSQR